MYLTINEENTLKYLLNNDPTGSYVVQRGLLLFLKNTIQYEKAIEWFNEILKLHPEHDYALHMKITTLLQQGNRGNDAIVCIDKWKLISGSGQETPNIYKGQALLQLHEWELAKNYFESVTIFSLETTPDFSYNFDASFFSYAVTLFNTENYKESIYNCNKMLDYKLNKKQKKCINILKNECYQKLDIRWWNFIQKRNILK